MHLPQMWRDNVGRGITAQKALWFHFFGRHAKRRNTQKNIGMLLSQIGTAKQRMTINHPQKSKRMRHESMRESRLYLAFAGLVEGKEKM